MASGTSTNASMVAAGAPLWQKATRAVTAHAMSTGGWTLCGRQLPYGSRDALAGTRRCGTCSKLAELERTVQLLEKVGVTA